MADAVTAKAAIEPGGASIDGACVSDGVSMSVSVAASVGQLVLVHAEVMSHLVQDGATDLLAQLTESGAHHLVVALVEHDALKGAVVVQDGGSGVDTEQVGVEPLLHLFGIGKRFDH